MTKETTTTTTTTTRFKTKPKTFLDVVKMLLAADIAAGNLKICSLKESGKFGRGHFLITGEDENGPFKDYFYFNYQPGDRFMTGFVLDKITNESYEIVEDMQRIYGLTDYDCMQEFYANKKLEIFSVVV